jgi:putative endonuclease
MNRGAAAEGLAARFLASQGLAIVSRNYRCRGGEIDIVARDGSTLVFVEVRMRSNRSFGGPAESITFVKRRRLRLAAQHYLARLRREPPCRFDAVLLDALDAERIEWLRAIDVD